MTTTAPGTEDPVSEGTCRRFLFVGNAPYRNRGCEAIVRGTMEILSSTFGPDLRVQSGVMASPETVAAQGAAETDRRVESFSVSQTGPRGSRKWWLSQANSRLGTGFQHHVHDLDGHLEGVSAALEIGGDNYSLDYAGPLPYVAVDRYLQQREIPVVLWGASVGPFDRDEKLAPRMFEHLRRLDGIFVREPRTLRYLQGHGVEQNVRMVADPAFAMTPAAPEESTRALVREGAVGINLSPLLARFGGASDLEAWRKRAGDLVIAVAERVRRPILLVPHVGAPNPADDDFAFLRGVRELVLDRVKVPVDIVPDGLGAAQSKWLIGRCSAFAGARTHATIAALSSCVPTLSLSYSVKALGINEDLFGHVEFCLPANALDPDSFVDGIARILREETSIRDHLRQEVPKARERAMRAGPLLRDLLKATNGNLAGR